MKSIREKSYSERVKKNYKSLLKEIYDNHIKIEPYVFIAEVDANHNTVKIINRGNKKPVILKTKIKIKPKKKGAKV